MSNSREDIHYSAQTSWNRPQAARSSSSRSGRVPISETEAYSWLRVQKIMEFSDQQPESESESLENPTSPESQTDYLTRIKSCSSSSASSDSTNDGTCIGVQDRAVDHTDPLTCGKHALSTNLFVNQSVPDDEIQHGH